MSHPSTFVIPAGVRFHAGQLGVSVEHSGDIVLEAPIGGRLDRVRSRDGSVTIHGRATIEHIEAPKGTVRLEGPVQVGNIQADVVELASSPFRARAVRGHRQIVVGPIRIDADVLMAPRIDIDPKATGRVPIVECHNEPGPSAIKGGFSVAEYGELLGDARKFLADRGLEPLEPAPEAGPGGRSPGPPPPTLDASSAPTPPVPAFTAPALVIDAASSGEDVTGENAEDPDTSPGRISTSPLPAENLDFVVLGEPTLEESRRVDTTPVTEVSIVVSTETEAGATPEERALWEAPDAPSIVIEDEEVLAPIAAFAMDDLALPPGAAHPPHIPTLAEASGFDAPDGYNEGTRDRPLDRESLDLGRMLQQTICDLRRFYPKDEEPPPITILATLIEEGRIDELSDRLHPLWRALVNHHREHGIRIRRQVTNIFNDIQSLVKGPAR